MESKIFALFLFGFVVPLVSTQGATWKYTNASTQLEYRVSGAASCKMGDRAWLYGGRNETTIFSYFFGFLFPGSEFTSYTGWPYNDTGAYTLDPRYDTPSSRFGAALIPNEAENSVYLFGGYFYGPMNDLWIFNFSARSLDPDNYDLTFWTWLNGKNLSTTAYGTQDYPGGRYGMASWADSINKQFYIYGGYGYPGSVTTPGYIDDLWMYDMASKVWSWMGGSNLTSSSSNDLSWPSRRINSAFCTSSTGDFYLFGGNDDTNYYADLWMYNTTLKVWTCLRCGSTYINSHSSANITAGKMNTPGGRTSAALWCDNPNHLMLYGGQGYGTSVQLGALADEWVYIISTDEWWLTLGPMETENFDAIYGQDSAGYIGSRYGAAYFTDARDQIWLFGGQTGEGKYVNDLWQMKPFLCGNNQVDAGEQCDGGIFCTSGCQCNNDLGYSFNGAVCQLCPGCSINIGYCSESLISSLQSVTVYLTNDILFSTNDCIKIGSATNVTFIGNKYTFRCTASFCSTGLSIVTGGSLQFSYMNFYGATLDIANSTTEATFSSCYFTNCNHGININYAQGSTVSINLCKFTGCGLGINIYQFSTVVVDTCNWDGGNSVAYILTGDSVLFQNNQIININAPGSLLYITTGYGTINDNYFSNVGVEKVIYIIWEFSARPPGPRQISGNIVDSMVVTNSETNYNYAFIVQCNPDDSISIPVKIQDNIVTNTQAGCLQRIFDVETCQSVTFSNNTVANSFASSNLVCATNVSMQAYYFNNISGSMSKCNAYNLVGPLANYSPSGVTSVALMVIGSYLNLLTSSFTNFTGPNHYCNGCTDASGYSVAAVVIGGNPSFTISSTNFTNFFGGNGATIAHTKVGNTYKSYGGDVYTVFGLDNSSTVAFSTTYLTNFSGGNGGPFYGATNQTCRAGHAFFSANVHINPTGYVSVTPFATGQPCHPLDPCSLSNGGCLLLAPCNVNPNDTADVICGDCPPGLSGNGTSCVTDSPCNFNNGGCFSLSTCSADSNNVVTCGPCPSNYVGDGRNCTSNPCSTNNGGCFALSTCALDSSNTSVICGSCPPNYTGDGRNCTKKTSTTASCQGNGGCDFHTTCSVLPSTGSVSCGPCPEGLNGTGLTICTKLCGNQNCDTDKGENCVTCAADCPSPCALCGDRFCNATGGETCSNCFEDCGPCPLTRTIQCNPPDCSGHGTCMPNGVCQCSAPYTGASCSEAPAPVQVVVQNTTTTPIVSIAAVSQKTVFGVVLTELRERRTDGGLDYEIIFTTGSNFTLQENAAQATQNKQWLAHAQLENQATLDITIYQFGDPAGTPINFANTTTIYGQNQVKIGIKVQNWPFRALSNSLELVFNTLVGDSEISQKSDCLRTEKNANDSVLTLSINVDGITMYGQYEPNAEVDNTIRLITYTLNATDNSIVAKAPHFWDTLVIDPSFSILVEAADKAGCGANSKSGFNKKLIAAIAVPVGVFVVALVVALVVLIPRLHLKSQIFKAKRRTKVDGGVEL